MLLKTINTSFPKLNLNLNDFCYHDWKLSMLENHNWNFTLSPCLFSFSMKSLRKSWKSKAWRSSSFFLSISIVPSVAPHSLKRNKIASNPTDHVLTWLKDRIISFLNPSFNLIKQICFRQQQMNKVNCFSIRIYDRIMMAKKYTSVSNKFILEKGKMRCQAKKVEKLCKNNLAIKTHCRIQN